MKCKNCGIELSESYEEVEMQGRRYGHYRYAGPDHLAYCEIESKRQHRYIPHIVERSLDESTNT